MAVLDYNGLTITQPQIGIQFTKVTDSSADWASVANSTYFYDKTDKLVYYKDSAGTVISIFSSSGSVPQANKIYVDSINGVNATGRGRVDNPYLTPEYALTQISNTGTFSGNNTINSTSITSVSSTSNLSVGQFLSGTGIPYNTRIVAISGSTLTLSQACTSTNTTITITYYTPYTIVCSGDFTILTTLEKAAVFWDFGNSSINWGAINLFTISSTKYVPFVLDGGYFYGKTSSSCFINGNNISAQSDFIIKPKYIYTLTTSYAISLTNNNDIVRKFTFECPHVYVPFGYVAIMQGAYSEVWTWIGYSYGLLGGITIDFVNAISTFNYIGRIETPSSVNAINFLRGGRISLVGEVKGSFVGPAGGSITGNITGTTTTIASSEYSGQFDILGLITSTTINCSGYGAININSAKCTTLNNTCYDLKVNAMTGNYVGTGSSKGELKGVVYTSSEALSINLSGTCKVILHDQRLAVNGAPSTLTIGSGCTLENRGESFFYMPTINGTLINYGILNLYTSGQLAPNITGTFRSFGNININRSGAESSNNTPCLIITSGTIILDGGTIQCANADSKSGLIRKTATGGKLILKGQTNLKVANGLAPLQILSNIGTAQDVLDFSVITNGAVGFRIADTFTDITYGTAYAPNLLVGGDKKESTTYTW